ncbi:MAG: DNA-binding response regulator [Planctomycetes bacterium]|nr:DNA-binding response regulator [Planctomycetota bacterium]
MSVKSTALIVEDEQEIGELVRFHLQREGFECAVTRSGRRALEMARQAPPKLMILDLMLPDLDGLEVCKRMKEHDDTRAVPIVMLSARGSENDIVSGIELGADDYVTKPFSPRVLMARIHNALRRTTAPVREQATESTIVRCSGKLVIDKERHQVSVNGKQVALTITEFEMLNMLARKPGFVRTRDQIIAAVHGPLTVLSQRTIDVHITAIRRKIGDLGEAIETVRGVGYRFADGEAVTAE